MSVRRPRYEGAGGSVQRCVCRSTEKMELKIQGYEYDVVLRVSGGGKLV